MRISAALFALLLHTGLAFALAQSEPSPPVDPLVQKLLERIDALERRVAELEGRRRPDASEEPAPEPEAAAAPQAGPRFVEPVPEVQPTYPNLKFRGFTDFNFSATDESGDVSGFNEGQFVLHLSSALSPRISFFGEVALTARATGFNSSVERAIVRLDHNDFLKLSFGRYHTPVNWWNTSYHHGLWLQTSIDRPEMARIGGIFIPVHFVGGLVEGSVPAGGLNFNYNVGVGNGRGDLIVNAGDSGDFNNNRAWVGNVFVKPNRPFGLQAGGSVYRDKITLRDGREFREWISAAHVVWLREDPEFVVEFANVRHQALSTGETFDNQGLYVQFGYRLPWMENAFKPYYRYEYIDVAGGDPLFLELSNLRASIVGFRYDFSFFAALKTEFRHLVRPGSENVNGGFIQISFVF